MSDNLHDDDLSKTLNTNFSVSSSMIHFQNNQKKEVAKTRPTAPLSINPFIVKSSSSEKLSSNPNLASIRNSSKNNGEKKAAYEIINSPLLTPHDRNSPKNSGSFISSLPKLQTPDGFSNFNQQAYIESIHQKAKQPKHNEMSKHSLSTSVFNYPYYTFVMPESCYDEDDVDRKKQNIIEPVFLQSRRKQLKSLSPILPPNGLFYLKNNEVLEISSPSLSPVSNVSSCEKYLKTEHVPQQVCTHKICKCLSSSSVKSIPMLSVNIEDNEGITTTVNIGLSFSKSTAKQPVCVKPSRIDFNGKQIWCRESY